MMDKVFLKKHWVLFLPMLLLVFFAAITGWMSETLYSNNNLDLSIKLAYYDLSLLIIILPVSLICFILSVNNYLRARLFTLGLTVYLMFSFGVTLFTSAQNNFFLVYISILTLSTFYFIKGLVEFQRILPDAIDKRTSRIVSIVLLFSAISGAIFLLSDAITALATPSNETMVNAPQVLDLAFILPITIYGAVRLWKNKKDGILISSIMMIFFVFIGISVVMMEIGILVRAGIEIDEGKVYSFSFISLLNIITTAMMYRKLSFNK